MFMMALERSFAQRYFTEREAFKAKASSVKALNQDNNDVQKKGILTLDENKKEARISIHGPLTKNGPDWIDLIFGFGGTGYKNIVLAIKDAAKNSNIDKIYLDMDTPGGSVDGVDMVYAALKEAKKEKEIIAVNQGMIASAGYWIASACDKILSTAATNETGSIGVIIVTYDFSKHLDDLGIKQVVIVSENAPDKYPDVSKKHGIQILQDRVDAIERIFHKRVADGRGITTQEVIEKYGKGRVLISQDPNKKEPDALKMGLIDGMILGEGQEIIDTTSQSEETMALKKESKKSKRSREEDEDLEDERENSVDEDEDLEDHDDEDAMDDDEETSDEEEDAVDDEEDADEDEDKKTKRSSKKTKKAGASVLNRICASNPGLASIIRKRDASNFEKGRAHANILHKKKITAAGKFVGNSSYPSAISDMAIQVIKGTAKLSALNALVTFADQEKTKGQVTNGINETTMIGDVPVNLAGSKSESADGIASNPDQFSALMKKVGGK